MNTLVRLGQECPAKVVTEIVWAQSDHRETKVTVSEATAV